MAGFGKVFFKQFINKARQGSGMVSYGQVPSVLAMSCKARLGKVCFFNYF